MYKIHDSFWISGESKYYLEIMNSDLGFDLISEDSNFAIFENKIVTSELYSVKNLENLTFTNSTFSGNLLANPTFINGAEGWLISQESLSNLEFDRIQNINTLLLFGQENWFTTCHQTITVKPDQDYNINFIAKSYNTTDMHAKILWFNTNDNLTEENALSVDFIPLSQMNLIDGKWFQINEIFRSPQGSKKAIIWFGANRLSSFKSTVLYLGNISVKESKIVVKNLSEFIQTENIDYTRIDPTQYSIELNASSPFILAFASTYNPQWICWIENEKIDSFPLFGMLNGFCVDKVGPIKIVLKYAPQVYYFSSVIVSTLFLIIIFLGFVYFYMKIKGLVILQYLKRLVKKFSVRKVFTN